MADVFYLSYNLAMAKALHEVPVSIRMPKSFVDRVDRLIPRLQAIPQFAAVGHMSRSKVLRLAIAAGLEHLESEHGRKKKGRRR